MRKAANAHAVNSTAGRWRAVAYATNWRLNNSKQLVNTMFINIYLFWHGVCNITAEPFVAIVYRYGEFKA